MNRSKYDNTSLDKVIKESRFKKVNKNEHKREFKDNVYSNNNKYNNRGKNFDREEKERN